MGKVYGLWPLTLQPGVRADEFEQAAQRLIEQTPQVPGWRFTLLKGARRAGGTVSVTLRS